MFTVKGMFKKDTGFWCGVSDGKYYTIAVNEFRPAPDGKVYFVWGRMPVDEVDKTWLNGLDKEMEFTLE